MIIRAGNEILPLCLFCFATFLESTHTPTPAILAIVRAYRDTALSCRLREYLVEVASEGGNDVAPFPPTDQGPLLRMYHGVPLETMQS